MYAYPLCSEETDTAMGDGSCDDTICQESEEPQCDHKIGQSRASTQLANGYGEKWFGYFNEPYFGQADVSPAGAFLKWDDFMTKVDTYAINNGFEREEMKILGPSVGTVEDAMLWAEQFYLPAADQGIIQNYSRTYSYAINSELIDNKLFLTTNP